MRGRMVIETSAFTGFRPEAIDFLAELAQNNDRAWFQPRKADFERLLKEPMEALVAALADRLRGARAPARGGPEAVDLRASTATRGSPRTSRRTRPTSTRASRGSAADRPRQLRRRGRTAHGGYFNLHARRDYVGGGMWTAREAASRRLPRAPSSTSRIASARRSRIRPSSPSSGRSHSHESLKRVPPGLPARPPDGRAVPVQGRRLRPPLSDDDIRSPELPDILADAYATAVPVFRFLSTLG